MVVLHATWAPARGRFLIWGEEPPAPRRGRASTAARRPHPFAAPAETLAALVGVRGAAATVLLRLPVSAPSRRRCPLACRALAGEDAAPNRASLLRSFLSGVMDAAVRAWAGELCSHQADQDHAESLLREAG